MTDKDKVIIGITGFEIWARDYVEEPTDFTLHFKVGVNPNELLKIIESFQEDIEALIKEKYTKQ